MSNRITTVLKGILPTLALAAIGSIAATIVEVMGIALYIYNGHFASTKDFYNGMYSYAKTISSSPYIYLIYGIANFIVMFFWIKSLNKKNAGTHVSVSPKVLKGWMVPALLFMGVMFQIFTNYIAEFLMIIMPKAGEFYSKIMEQAGLSGGSITVPMLIYALILGPVIEEMTFRGATYSILRKNLNFWAANVIQALLFGLIHMNLIQGIYAFLLGLALGYIMERTGNILATIVLHIAFNSISGVVSLLTSAISGNPVLFCVTLLVSMCGSYIGIMFLKRITEAR
jgi:membrane protease YdiL (CAAX protease family)